MTETDFVRRLAKHPKLMGVLFTALLLLGEAGTVVASDGNCLCSGP